MALTNGADAATWEQLELLSIEAGTDNEETEDENDSDD